MALRFYASKIDGATPLINARRRTEHLIRPVPPKKVSAQNIHKRTVPSHSLYG